MGRCWQFASTNGEVRSHLVIGWSFPFPILRKLCKIFSCHALKMLVVKGYLMLEAICYRNSRTRTRLKIVFSCIKERIIIAIILGLARYEP